MPYEDTAFAPTDMLDGYPSMPDYGYTQPAAAAAPAPAAEFDPRRDIDPMANRIFQDIGNARHIKPMEKLAMQSKFLSGVQDVQMQRMKLEGEKRQSMIESLRIQEMQDSIIANRQRQQAAANQTVRRTEFSGALKSVLDSDADPITKLGTLDKLAAQDLAMIATDTNMVEMYRTAKSMIQLPKVSTLTESQIMESMEKGVPANVIATGDPYLIGGFRRLAEIEEKKKSEDEETQMEARKNKAALLRDLAKDAVDPEPDPVLVLIGFKVQVRGAHRVRIEQHFLQKTHHRRVFHLLRHLVGGLGGCHFDAAVVEIEIATHDMVDRLARAGGESLDQFGELVDFGDHPVHCQLGGELDFLGGLVV